MIETPTRLLETLKRVFDAGPLLEPNWDAGSNTGFSYFSPGTPLDSILLLADLEHLAEHDYLEKMFVDRLSLCPKCGSHRLNAREICLQCHSANIVPVETVLHYRCAFVAPMSAFTQEAGGLRCPKCRKLLQERGTDYGRPGNYFSCRSCGASFQMPDVGALCLSCGSRFAAGEMETLRSRDVFAYRVTPLGETALQRGRLCEGDGEARIDPKDGIYRRRVLLDLVDDDCRRRRVLGTPFGLILFAEPGDESTFSRLKSLLVETDKLGRLSRGHLVALLSGATPGRTKAVLREMQKLGVTARIVDGIDKGDIVSSLDRAAAQHESRH